MTKISLPFKGLLFDLDGTLVDSLAAVDRCWKAWANKMGLDQEYVMSIIHGRPARESQAELLPHLSDQELDDEIRWLENAEATDMEGVVAREGTIELLTRLDEMGVPWAIVTSGTYPVANARINAAGLPQPRSLVTADRVTKGKPDPEPFELGAKELGLTANECIVFEDAPAGVAAGRSAGSEVVAILSHNAKAELDKARLHIDNLSLLAVITKENHWVLSLSN